MWPDRRLIELCGIEHPIVLAPMAGAMDFELAAAVSSAGGLGSLPCAMLTPDKLREEVANFRTQAPAGALNLNFFCHTPPVPDKAREAAWRERLAGYYAEFGIDPGAPVPSSNRAPFDSAFCDVVEELSPRVVSFHFGLPAANLLERVKAAGCLVFGCATTVAEAKWLAAHGADAIIAQGTEAGGHRGIFLADDPLAALASQPGLFALLPQMVDAVTVPVIAAGAVADARGIAAALALGAAGVQIGSAYLHCPESKISAPFRAALTQASDDNTAITNVMTGRPARGLVNRAMRELGPVAADTPRFPLAAGALAPLRAKAEAADSGEFSPLWSGQAASLGRAQPAAEVTRRLAAEAAALLQRLAGGQAAD